MRGRGRGWLERAILLALLPLLLGAGGAPERIVTPEPAAERELVERINQSRERQGLPRLEWNGKLAEAARAHALTMSLRGQVTHRFPDESPLRPRIAESGLRFDFVGENVGRARDAALVHEDFLLSPGHRVNILQEKANAVGVGAVRFGDDLFVAEDFAHVIPDYHSDQVEEIIVQRVGELRQQAQQPPLERGVLGPLREEACAMARRDSVIDGHQPASWLRGGVVHTIAYATADPERIPDQLRDEVLRERPLNFNVGACFGRSPSYPSGAYWVMVVFYFPQNFPQK